MPSVVLLQLHEYMYVFRDIYDTHQLRVIDDGQLMTWSVIDYALRQAMVHIKHLLIQFFGGMKLWKCVWYTRCHISN